jgi:hypothetical protein
MTHPQVLVFTGRVTSSLERLGCVEHVASLFVRHCGFLIRINRLWKVLAHLEALAYGAPSIIIARIEVWWVGVVVRTGWSKIQN